MNPLLPLAAELPSAGFSRDIVLLVILASSVLGNLASVWALFAKRKIAPTPLPVEIVKQLVTHEEFERFESETRDGLKALDMRFSNGRQGSAREREPLLSSTREMVEKCATRSRPSKMGTAHPTREDVGGVHDRINDVFEERRSCAGRSTRAEGGGEVSYDRDREYT
jgi:hypothetical protein